MAEGLWHPLKYKFADNFPLEKLLFSMVKVIPDRTLQYQIFETKEEAESWSTSFQVDEHGFETMNVGFHQGELDIVHDPSFSNQLFVHEFCELYKKGQKFPCSAKVTGSASGFLLGADGLVVTNYHIVSGIIEAKKLDLQGYFAKDPILAPSLKIQILSDINSKNELIYSTIDDVYLYGNYSKQDAFKNHLDLAVLKIDYKPKYFLEMAKERVRNLEKLFLFGFPMRTARKDERKKMFDYQDANYDLRVSTGLSVLMEENYFLTDHDGGPGSSGSVMVNESGDVVGVYTGSKGNGIVTNDGVYRKICYADSLVKFFS